MGERIMQDIEHIVRQRGIRFFVLRALTHVLGYYHDKMGFELLHPIGNFLDRMDAYYSAQQRQELNELGLLTGTHNDVLVEMGAIHRVVRNVCREMDETAAMLEKPQRAKHRAGLRGQKLALTDTLRVIMAYQKVVFKQMGWAVPRIPRPEGMDDNAYRALLESEYDRLGVRSRDNEDDGIYMVRRFRA